MTRDRRNQERGNEGFSLVEMLVASAIFAIAATVAFILYSASQNSYKSAENFTNQQQATRVAFDRMMSDLRLAGYNYNPDGDKTRVDQQIEGAWDTAVTIRGDFDFEDPVASQTPESSLPGTVYNVVTTGNDEILTYVLAKPGPVGSESMDLWLDADNPRTKTVKKVTIPNIVLTQNDPPYTLYRVSLANVTGAFPSAPQPATSFVYEPVADNIMSMTFQYYDGTGNKLNPDTPTNPADDLAGLQANVVTRGQIRKVKVNLVGMTANPDMNYTDVNDANAATQSYRKFNLSSDVNPENLGKVGIKDVDTTPPPAPTNVALVPGHCAGMLVKWDQPSSSDGVSSYVVKWWPSGSPSTTSTQTFVYPHSEYGVVDYLGHAFVPGLATGPAFCFEVQAKDAAGNQSGWSPSSGICGNTSDTIPPGANPTNYTLPAQPQSLAATSGQDSKIPLTWALVKTNSNILAGDPNTIGGLTIMRDPAGYRLQHDTSNTFPAPTLVADNTTTPPLSSGSTSFTDTTVTNCQTYYYRLATLDTCGNISSWSSTASGQATTTVPPSAPTGLVGTRTSANNIALSWTAVTTNVNGFAETIGLYKVYRAMAVTGTPAATIPSGSYSLMGTSTTTSYNDALSSTDKQNLNSGYSYFYEVTAADLCPNESARSAAVEVYCKTTNTYTTTPANGASVGGTVNIVLSWSGTDVVTRVRAHIPSLTGGSDVYDQTVFNPSGNSATLPQWNSAASPGGAYTIMWEAENNQGCVKSWPTTLTVTASLACQISATNPNLSPTTGKPSNQYKTLTWDVQNNAGKDLTIQEIDVSWTNTVVCPTCPHKLDSIQWPTGTTVTTFSTPAATKAQAFYVFPGPLTFCAVNSGSCTTGPTVNMELNFSTSVGNGITSESITVDYFFQDTSGASGKCSLTIISGP